MKELTNALLLFAGILAAQPVSARTLEPSGVRAIFARHDPDGRLANTRIRFAGSTRIGRNLYRVYDLNFTNPISHHGMQRVAVVLNGRTFLGSYQTDGQTISVRGRRIFSSQNSLCERVTSIRLNGPHLARQVLFACDLRYMEHTI